MPHRATLGAANRDLALIGGGATLGTGMVMVLLLHCARHCPNIVGVRYYVIYSTINLTTDTQEVGFQGKPQSHHYHGHTKHKIGYTHSGPSDPPQDFIAIPDGTSIQFSWSPPATADRNGIITDYTLTCMSIVAGVNAVIMMTYAEAGNYTLGGLRSATEYNCSVFASNGIADGPSVSISVSTSDESEFFS